MFSPSSVGPLPGFLRKALRLFYEQSHGFFLELDSKPELGFLVERGAFTKQFLRVPSGSNVSVAQKGFVQRGALYKTVSTSTLMVLFSVPLGILVERRAFSKQFLRTPSDSIVSAS